MKGKSYCPPGTGKTRNIGGVKAPPAGSNPKIEKEALSKKSVGIIPGDGAPVRLDRPKRNRGGKC